MPRLDQYFQCIAIRPLPMDVTSAGPVVTTISSLLSYFHFFFVGIVLCSFTFRSITLHSRVLRSLVCSWIRFVFTFPISHRPLSYIALPLLDGGGGASPSVTRKLSIRPKSETTSSATNSFHSLFRMICLFGGQHSEQLDRGSG